MRTIIIKCDRCGKEISGYPVKIIPECVDREDDNVWMRETEEAYEFESAMTELDFCVDCTRKIMRYAAGGIKPNPDFEQAVQEMVESVTPPNEKIEEQINMAQIDCLEEMVGAVEQDKKGRAKLDTGKIMALTKAGWTAAQIADEMHIGTQAVYDARYRLKKEGKL